MGSPRRRRGLAIRLGIVALLLGGSAGAAVEGSRRILPPDGVVARGTIFDGDTLAEGASAADVVAARAAEVLGRQVKLYLPASSSASGERELLLDATLEELGATVDVDAAKRQLEAVGRSGTLEDRLDEAWQARQHKVAISFPVQLPADVINERLATFKATFDHKARQARWDFDKNEVVPHRDGEMLDPHAAVEALRAAMAASPRSVERLDLDVPIALEQPVATTEAVATMDRSVVLSSFDTRFGFVGNQTGRAQNVARAAQGIDGLAMMPGQVVSFNDLVGPRSIANGFAHAGEIYKGEMRRGVGGGTCQVASTYHAAAYLGGLEVVERSPHSRPSGYIRIGLDATVAFPHVDLRMRNPFPFPVLVHAFIRDRGTLVVELHGRERPVEVAFDAATVGIKKYKRKVRTAHWLEEGRIIRKQAGRKGVTIQKIRILRYTDGTEKTEETHDHYPPTTEIYYVPVGTDVEAELPPLPQEG